MNEVIGMTKDKLSKMLKDDSWIVDSVEAKAEILRIIEKFNDSISENQIEFDKWVQDNKAIWADWVELCREILESIDLDGKNLTELIDSRTDINGIAYPRSTDRLNSQIARSSEFRDGDTLLAEKMSNEFTEKLIDPKWYGAKGDGVTDDTEAIEATIRNCPDRGTIRFSLGTYLVSGTLNFGTQKMIDLSKATILFASDLDIGLAIATGTNLMNGSLSKVKGIVVKDAIYAEGNNLTISNLTSSNQKFENFIHLKNVKETRIINNRVDMDSDSLSGNFIFSDYSVNNMIYGNMVGYCNSCCLFGTTANPTHGNKSEGFLFGNNIIVKTRTAFKGDSVASLQINNNIIDFCENYGIQVTNGHTLLISNNWIQTTGKGACISAHSNYGNVTVYGNSLTSDSADSYSISSAAKRTNFFGNLISGTLKPATVVDATSAGVENNIYENEVNKPQYFRGKKDVVTKGTATLSIPYLSVVYDLYVFEKETTNFIKATGFKSATANESHTIDVLASNTLKLGARNPAGVQLIEGFTHEENLITVLKFKKI